MAKVKKKTFKIVFIVIFTSFTYRFVEVVLSYNDNVCIYLPQATSRRELQPGQLIYYVLNVSNSSN